MIQLTQVIPEAASFVSGNGHLKGETMEETGVARSYRAKSLEEQQAAYDSWAKQYEIDLCAMGYRIPAVLAAVATRLSPQRPHRFWMRDVVAAFRQRRSSCWASVPSLE